jgi:hypothetical protein
MPEGTEGGLDEAFLTGTEPVQVAAAPGEVTAQNFFAEGMGAGEALPSGPSIGTPTIPVPLSPLPGALMPEVDAGLQPPSGAPVGDDAPAGEGNPDDEDRPR